MKAIIAHGASTIAAQLAIAGVDAELVELTDDDQLIEHEEAHNIYGKPGGHGLDSGVDRAAARLAEKRQANEAIPDNIIPTRQILRFASRKGTLKQRLARGN